MRRHYYVVNGLQPWSKADEVKLDLLVGEGYIGNVVEKLIQNGYVLDEERKGLYTPDGVRVCQMCEAI